MTPTLDQIYAAIDATWPAASLSTEGGWTIRAGAGGGKRVSAATAVTEMPDIPDMEAASRAIGQDPLVMVRAGEGALDARLAEAGYEIVDPVTVYLGKSAEIAAPIPPVSGFHVDWPPLQIQRELWAEGGIGSARIDVMARVQGAKVALMGRSNDLPAGTGFAARHHDIAMVHALEVRPTLRRQGVALHMMRAAAYWAQDQGCPWLTLLVTEANQGANALYLGLGMQAVGHYHYRAAPRS